MSLFSFGNTKLPKSTAIFNISAAFDCASDKLGLCLVSKVCYAKKAELQYKSVLPYRRRQRNFWLGNGPEEFVSTFIKAKGRKKIKYLRLNEAGDFITQDCINKASKIAEILFTDHRIGMYCYTARRDLDFSKRGKLVVNGSSFMVDNNFLIQRDKSKLISPVCPADCRICLMCAKPLGLTINVKIH